MRRFGVVLLTAGMLAAGFGATQGVSVSASSRNDLVTAKKICHLVKRHGKKVKVCKTVKAKPTATETPTPTETPSPISVTSVGFYTSASHVNCTPASGRAFVFDSSVSEVDAIASLSGWHGQHTAAMEFYAPDGARYATFGPAVFTDIGSYCGWINVAGTAAAQHPGAWTLRVYIDSVQSSTTTFTLSAPQATSVPTYPLATFQLLTPPAPSPSFAYSLYHNGSFDGVIYTAGNQYAIAGLDCGGVQCGYEGGAKNSYGTLAPSGFMYVWIFAEEGAQQYSSSFYSSFVHFQLRGADGQVYSAVPSPPPYTHAEPVMGGAQLSAGDKNLGWMQFQVPAVAARYDVRWTATPFLQILTSFTVSP
jgi:hypothetical protein